MSDHRLTCLPVRIEWSGTLANREAFRDRYRVERDPIGEERLLWRAQSVRHLVHLTPGQTILHFGSGDLAFTRKLAEVTRNENPIVAASFLDAPPAGEAPALPPSVTQLRIAKAGAELEGNGFDCITGLDMLDSGDVAATLDTLHKLLVPGGQIVFFESNPWNPWLRLRRLVNALLRRSDSRGLLSRPVLYELFSEVGFIRVFAVFTDFVYAPLTRWLIRALRNLSIVAENTPGLRTFAGAILIHAQKPPRRQMPASPMLCNHPALRGKVSVVVPCHNEEMNIGPLIDRMIELYGDYIHEIIPVDDNSRDGTAEVIARYAARDPRIRPVYRTPPNGVGRAIADGYRAATGQWILSMDCDFQHLLPEVRDLFDAAAGGAKVAVGSRFSRHSILLNYPIMKIVSNRAFHLLAVLLMGRHFRDVTNNLKLIHREVADRLVLTSPGFSINAETGLQPMLMGYKIAEVPISWINRSFDMGTSTFKLVKVGRGYVGVLIDTLRALWFRSGPYASIRGIAKDRETGG
ncbi:MAG: glycosyltransferase [Paracoccaceae bacterium]